MDIITCIVETPKGSAIKYEYNTKLACFQLGKMLPSGMVFPYDFGYIPGTIGEDGDPLDVIIISDIPTFTGCAILCRIIGGIKALQCEKNGQQVRNDRFIAIPVKDAAIQQLEEISQLPEQSIRGVEQFFINYNEQSGKQFTPLDRMDAARALKTIEAAKTNDEPTRLIQLILPLYDSDGIILPEKHYKAIRKKMIEQFGGITCYTQGNAEGFWAKDHKTVVKDEVMVYEIMVSEIDKRFWKKYKQELKILFKQEEIIIRHSQIGLLQVRCLYAVCNQTPWASLIILKSYRPFRTIIY